ncbi:MULTISPECIES: cache domain-containing sensor histidine kinase [Enterococcus]|mgnify:CR=1 FL=1|uniref:histidine kinase n=2 Tax=Enterococcus faecium TaxID=1352 RepID=A0A7V8C6X3_ENTFC|nr:MULTISPECIES: sensor histidine kinase [Enterococcus]MBU5552331.1 histidine kinase [Enterococcus sp. S157_ASV_20]AON60766.1 ATP-binding protein [Enterococcus faecium]EKC6656455.1 histidine kinase [Enterococcus faecium]ELT6156634.1 histidine kinase [Enterococcus faecium]KAB7547029.1 ATP-binding protein [Enterococcus faecium]
MRKKIKEHELFAKLLFILFIGLFLQAIVISLFIYHRSRDAYIQLFNQSNDVVLKKIQSEFESLNDTIENTLAAFDSNPAVKSYFSNDPAQHMEQLQQLRTIQKMNDSLSKIHPMIDYDVLIFGENGRTFVGNDMLTAVSADSFFQSAIAQRVNERAADTQMLFAHHGLTLRDKKAPSVFFVKKLKNTLNHVYGYAVLSISSKQLANLFQSVVNPEISKISFMNEEQTIIASNEENTIGSRSMIFKKLTVGETTISNGQQLTRLPLYRQDCTLLSQVDLHSLSNQMGVIFPIILYNIVTLAFAGSLVFMYLDRHTKSINQLLSNAQHHYEQTIQDEKKKRSLEIQTMQAQIQPHFIYNTLTSLKFLIWQKKTDEAVQGIDSFITLLRSTIGKKEEVIPVKEEIKSVQSYIDLLSMRYGERISAKIMIPDELQSLSMPNMILQPIIENAYLHAFHNKTQGFITVYGKTKNQLLLFEVIDNGDGFDTENTKQKNDHFSGIGISHVDERIRLMYGDAYGLTIQSVIGTGTTVTICLPLLPKNQSEYQK